MKKTILLAIIVALMASCSSPEEKLLVESQAIIKKVKSFEYLEPITAKDSFKVYNDTFEARKADKTMHLLKAKEHYEKALEISKDGLENTGYKMMKELFQAEIDKAESDLVYIEETLKAYSTDCKGTSLEEDYKKMKYFKEMGDSIFFHQLKCTFISNETNEEEKSVFLLSADKSKIIKEIK